MHFINYEANVMTNDISDSCSIAEAAQRLSVSVDTVRRRIKTGEITGQRDHRGQWWLDMPADNSTTIGNHSVQSLVQSGSKISLGHASIAAFSSPEESLIAKLSDEILFLRRRLEAAEEELKNERENARLERQSIMSLLDLSGRSKS